MELKVSVNNSGIESAGLTHDYMQAISEYIWNGFDAKASHIRIEYTANALDHLTSFSIIDNGEGIDLSTIENTFGNFMDSVKKTSFLKSSSAVRGNRGKGRFSFVAFSGLATWHTIYKDAAAQKLLEYSIAVKRNTKDKCDYDNKVVSKKKETGTTVTFTELFGITAYSLTREEFIEFLGCEFGWFLLLNKERHYRISINGEDIPYKQLIAETEVRKLPIQSEGNRHLFKITFVRWTKMIGDKFYFYFLDGKQKEIAKELTSFNNNAMGFNHSVYVESSYFDSFSVNDKEESLLLFGASRSSPVYKTLTNALYQFIKEKQKAFVNGEAAEKLINTYERNGVIPPFRNNKYEQARKADLIDLVKGLYSIEPKLFVGLNKEQQKISIGLINLLLETDERDTIIELIGRIVHLTRAEREDLLNILQKTTMGKIVRTVNMIEARFKVIELIKSLIYDAKKFTSEIHHLQGAIEESYWLFGEQYHLVSANESFSVLQKKYLGLIGELEKEDKTKVKPSGKEKKTKVDFNRRPDIFLCRKHTIPDATDHACFMEENVMVELKRPSVVIGKEQLRQIEDYMEIIRTDEAFNSQKRCWKFLIVGNQLDEFVKGQYASQKEKGKKFLVKGAHNYEIYAYTWDDIFMMFDLRHKFIVDHLDFDKPALKRELLEKGIDLYNDPDPEVITMAIQEATA
ncbi:MAG TPA: ATP-binding protein [Puia sp.]|nr:ATP-binding protein [Puia sp.]